MQRMLLDAVDEILRSGSAAPADEVSRRLSGVGARPGEAAFAVESVAADQLLALRFGWAPLDPVAVVRWVSDRLGAEHGRRALGAAGLLGHPEAPRWSSVRPQPGGAGRLLPALVLLLAGVVALATEASADHTP
ncbi:hypothetical protein [Cryptosporangium japonicum]|uniref:Uncharacterized protein n=1 Tax=Cryptosporangium japonicum TaxID=80872 RepID=A0ABN0TWT7_9ACTN